MNERLRTNKKIVLERDNTGLSETLYALRSSFLIEKCLKTASKKTKSPKLSFFQSFYANFVKISIDFVDWIVANGRQG